MAAIKVHGLACPIDGTALQLGELNALRCANGHSFDRAREGYYNLLVVQHKASLDPGDTKQMVAARRRVLEAGCYAPIAECVAQTVNQLVGATSHESTFSILDAGCGEGYYLEAVAKALPPAELKRVQLVGIDISKWAIQSAAKRNGFAPCFWAVASNRHLPLARGRTGLILSMFGFPVWDAFAAVQPPTGRVLLVDPGLEHLIELRSVIYPEVKRSASPSLEAAKRAGYELEDERRLTFRFNLTSQAQIADLLAMTPHDHRAPIAGRGALALLESLALTGEVTLRVLARRIGPSKPETV